MVTQTDVNRTLVSVYDVLNIAGAVLLTLLLVASDIRRKNVFRGSKHDHNDVRRPSMWFIAIGSWIMLSISCCLLIGNQIGPPPPHGICLTQAVLVYSSPVLCTFSAAAFLLQVHLSISRPRGYPLPTLYHLALYAIAFLVPLGVFLETLVLGLINPSWVQRGQNGMYCNFSSEIWKITAGSILCALIAVLVLEVMISLSFLRAAQASRKASQNLVHTLEINIEDYHRQTISGNVLARILGFTLCILIALSCSLIQYLPFSIHFETVTIIQATLPCCAAIIFGTQKDIWKVWS